MSNINITINNNAARPTDPTDEQLELLALLQLAIEAQRESESKPATHIVGIQMPDGTVVEHATHESMAYVIAFDALCDAGVAQFTPDTGFFAVRNGELDDWITCESAWSAVEVANALHDTAEFVSVRRLVDFAELEERTATLKTTHDPFEIGLADVVADMAEDAVVAGVAADTASGQTDDSRTAGGADGPTHHSDGVAA